jgi:hypothetical protein
LKNQLPTISLSYLEGAPPLLYLRQMLRSSGNQQTMMRNALVETMDSNRCGAPRPIASVS